VVNYEYPDLTSWKKWMVLKTAAIKFPLLKTTQCRHTHTTTTKPPDAHSLPRTCSKLYHTEHIKCTISLKWTVWRLLIWSVRSS